MEGTWKSKTSDLIVDVEKVVDGTVFYMMPDYRGLQCTETALFMETMKRA